MPHMEDLSSHKSAIDSKAARIALGLLLLGVVGIGFAPVFIRSALPEVGPVAIGFWRLVLALPVLWTGAAFQKARTPLPQRARRRYDFLWLMVPGLFFAADLSLWHWSIKLTSIANATLLVNCAPLIVTPISWFWLKERFRPIFILGLVLAIAGAATMMWKSFTFSRAQLIGDVLALSAAVFYGGYQLSMKRLRAQYPTLTIMSWSAISSAVLLFLVAYFTGDSIVPESFQVWLALIGIALVSHVAGQGLIGYALGHLPVSFSSVSLVLQPVVSAAFAWIFLAEPLHRLQAIGGIIVLVGILFARQGSDRRRLAHQADA